MRGNCRVIIPTRSQDVATNALPSLTPCIFSFVSTCSYSAVHLSTLNKSVEVKLISAYAMKGCGGMEVQLLSFLASQLYGGEKSTSCAGS